MSVTTIACKYPQPIRKAAENYLLDVLNGSKEYNITLFYECLFIINEMINVHEASEFISQVEESE